VYNVLSLCVPIFNFLNPCACIFQFRPSRSFDCSCLGA